ncbi:YggS family pyridoxal phosphate-dependent enzyme [Candidatus Auribacterota bacterium]
MDYLKNNINEVREQIQKSASKARRSTKEITLVSVTKTVEAEMIKKAIEYGILVIGENKIQEAKEKKGDIKAAVKWHMIGHLQTNKVKDAVTLFDMIQSVDSLKLALEIDKRAGQAGKIMKILLEVNVSAEESKFGLKENDVIPLLKEIAKFDHLKVKGLMTMAPFTNNEALIRKTFSDLRLLKEKIKQENIKKIDCKHLSMGMSHDYPIAIEEGATMIRVGSAIFGKYANR